MLENITVIKHWRIKHKLPTVKKHQKMGGVGLDILFKLVGVLEQPPK